MSMTLTEIIEHTDNLAGLLRTKRRQLEHMPLDSVARRRHEGAITALEGRVSELRRHANALGGRDEPTLQLVRVRPGVPPFADVSSESEPVRDLATSPGDLCA